MARERYLINAGEESIHDNEIVLTEKKDIRKNWWHYHKTYILVGALAVLMVFSFIYSIVTKATPDYTVAFMTSYIWPTDALEDMETYLEEYGEDVNGDGQVIVKVNNYVLGNASSKDADPNQLQASVVQFTADVTELESIIFIYDTGSFDYIKQSGIEGFFLYRDGSEMAETATDFENTQFAWNEISGLAEYMPKDTQTGTEDYTIIPGEDIKELYEAYTISVRSKPEKKLNEKEEDYYRSALAFFERLLENEKTGKTTEQSE